MTKIVKTFPNFLSREDWDTVFNDYIRRDRWGYGHWSDMENPSVSEVPLYWTQNLSEDDFFNTYMLGMIEDATGMKFKCRDVYAGGNTFGTSGDLHTDSKEENNYTFLYHASPTEWKPMYGGKTSFYPENGENEYYEFVPNSGLFFDGRVTHVGEPTTKFFTSMRVCIAFKLILR